MGVRIRKAGGYFFSITAGLIMTNASDLALHPTALACVVYHGWVYTDLRPYIARARAAVLTW